MYLVVDLKVVPKEDVFKAEYDLFVIIKDIEQIETPSYHTNMEYVYILQTYSISLNICTHRK